MSHIRCPVCGKDSAIRNFDPASLDDDIYIRQVYSLGRGRGFTYGPDESVLGDEVYSPMICNRCLDILRLMIQNNVVTKNRILRSLKMGIPIADSDDIIPYDEFIKWTSNIMSEKIKINETLKAKNSASSASTTVLSNELDELKAELSEKNKINSVLKKIYNITECDINLNENDWTLHIKEIDPVDIKLFCRILYPLTYRERNLIKERIVSENKIIDKIFDIFKMEPTVRDVTDMLENSPSLIYKYVHEIL